MLYGNDNEIKALETQNKILSAFYEGEKVTRKPIGKSSQEEIAKVAQVDRSEVQDVIRKYE